MLASLDALAKYDPGVATVRIVSEQRSGPGSARQCDLKPGGWFKERVSHWREGEELGFELYECTLPVRSLEHRYVLRPEAGGTRVEQRMRYKLKYGLLGALLDLLFAFFAGLKTHVEAR